MRIAPALFALLSLSSLAQTPAVSKSFVIADVHTSPFTSNPFMHGNSIQGDRYFLTQATMVDLIATAYGVDALNVQGGPTWLERNRYDIRAKVPPNTTQADVKLMLRALLAEQLRNACGHVDHQRVVAAARFDQQHFDRGIGAQPVSEHAAGASGTDDDVVIGFHDWARSIFLWPGA